MAVAAGVEHPMVRVVHRVRRSVLKRLASLREKYPDYLLPETLSCYGYRFVAKHNRISPMIRRALTLGDYEGPEVKLIKKYLRPDDNVIEIGVGIGATTLVIHGIVGSERLVVFDADANTLDLARRNFDLNGASVVIENYVLVPKCDAVETVTFFSHPSISSSSLIQRDGATPMSVPAKPFEDVLAEQRATALVLDIEGGEVSLLTKAENFGDLRIIMMETHARHVGKSEIDRLLKHLETRNFTCVERISGDDFVVYLRND